MNMTDEHDDKSGSTQVTPLRTARLALGLTQGDVWRAVGVDQGQYSRIERGVSIPSPELADRIAKYFAGTVTRDQILFPADYLAVAPEAAKASQL